MRIDTLTLRGRVAALGLALAVSGAGVAILLVGFVLLAGLLVIGGLLGAVVVVSRKLRGGHLAASLDPALRVFPDRTSG